MQLRALYRILKNQDVAKAEERTPDVQVVREDDPRCAEVKAAGYRVVGGWGACQTADRGETQFTSVLKVLPRYYLGSVDGLLMGKRLDRLPY